MKVITRFRLVVGLCLGLALVSVANTAAAHGSGYGPGYGGYGYGYGYGPHMGPGYGRHMGPGHGRHMGPGYGPGLTGPRYGPGPHHYGRGMMGPGYGRPHGAGPMGPGYSQEGHRPGMMGPYGRGMYGPGARAAPDRNLSATDVRAHLEHWLRMHGLSGLRVGDVSEQDEDTIMAEVTDPDGKVVQRYEFDRHTGAMRPAS